MGLSSHYRLPRGVNLGWTEKMDSICKRTRALALPAIRLQVAKGDRLACRGEATPCRLDDRRLMTAAGLAELFPGNPDLPKAAVKGDQVLYNPPLPSCWIQFLKGGQMELLSWFQDEDLQWV